MVKILAWSDSDDICPQLRSEAKRRGDAVTLDRSGFPDANPDTIARGLAAAAAEAGADLVLIGSTKLGKDIGPRVAALLERPYAADIQELETSDGIAVKRMVLSGNCMATYKMGASGVCTAGVGIFEEGDAEVPTLAPAGVEASSVQITGTAGEEGGDFDLASSDYVVGVGRGFKAQEDIALAQALADKLPGGAVGCSRPVAADLKWLGEEHWIGLSGHQIRPKVYFAAGVSGQIQHVAGIRGSKLIVAINTNKDAPIFQVCDYGIVGDLYDVLPKLTNAV